MPGAVLDLEGAVTESERLPVGQGPGDLRLRAPRPKAAGDLAERTDHFLRDPVAQHQRRGLLVVALRVAAEVLHEWDDRVERRHLGLGAAGDDVHQPEVVDVLVADDHQLQVFDPVPERVQLVLELVEGLAGVRPGVDQSERLVLDQVAVDAAYLERGRDSQGADPRLGDERPGVSRLGH